MTLRSRLTLWYAGILFASTFLISGLTYRQMAIETRESDAQSADRRAQEKRGQAEVVAVIFWWGIPAALLGLAGGWWLMRKAMAPVVTLTHAAAGIHERNLSERLARSGNGDEFDQLTDVFNAMVARLDGSFNRIREFTLHASHELKTPLTVMRGELETALAEEADPIRRERMTSQLDEIQRLAKIVDGLTLLTKADAGQIELKHEPVSLDELVRDNFADAQILAQPNSIAAELNRCDKITVLGDRHRLRQLLLNLTDNAIKYNLPQGCISMSLEREGAIAELRISNTGPGVPPELQERVFDHFFRGEASHSSEVEGCGLGLTIARWIVSAHGGSIRLTSHPQKLTTVTVRLPIAGGHPPAKCCKANG